MELEREEEEKKKVGQEKQNERVKNRGASLSFLYLEL